MKPLNTKEQLHFNKNQIESSVTENAVNKDSLPTIIAVTKTVDSSTIEALYELGQRHFAENRPGMFLEKFDTLSKKYPDLVWHFIGNLQTRPVKKIINQIDYLHSLDRISLAKEIQKRADNPVNCFLQVNVSGEDSKSGFSPEQLEEVIHEIAQYDKVKIVGLMTMAPIDASDDELHAYFNRLKSLQVDIEAKNIPTAPCTEVSMGMSQDYPIAVQEGATFLRVGSAFFENL